MICNDCCGNRESFAIRRHGLPFDRSIPRGNARKVAAPEQVVYAGVDIVGGGIGDEGRLGIEQVRDVQPRMCVVAELITEPRVQQAFAAIFAMTRSGSGAPM